MIDLPLASYILRLYWLYLGHAAIVVTAIILIAKNLQSSMLANLIYISLVLGLIGVRYVDIVFYGGPSAAREPATLKQWGRFSLIVAAYSSVLGMVVQIFGAV